MLTQTNVKRSLAYSTVAQMGFMMLQCGLGAFALAILHLVAHSLYKAHAFLSSGNIVRMSKAAWVPTERPAAHPLILAGTLTTPWR
jgi:NAD(P)H-quinone oxidoreductase subunit 5